jgi:hypothetical protein
MLQLLTGFVSALSAIEHSSAADQPRLLLACQRLLEVKAVEHK